MTPRLVIIFAFAFACMVIVSGAIIGGRKHVSASRDSAVPTASDAAGTASTQANPNRQTSAKQDATPAETPGQDSAQQGSTPPEPIKPDVVQQGAAPREPTKLDSTQQVARPPEPIRPDATEQQNAPPPKAAPQDAAQPEPAHKDADQQESADPLPIIVTYELKKHRDAARFIARDPKAFWIRQIVARIEDKKIDLPTPLGQPVAVQLEFVVGRNGALLSKTISKSSGSDEADKTAIAMLERAQPFPPMPEGLQDQQMAFSLPVRFH